MKKVILILVFSSLLISFSSPVFSADIEIAAVVEKNTLSVGEPFIYQIQIQGSNNASGFPEEKWVNSGFLNNFKVEFLGGQNNSSRQVSIINGRRKETINTGYIISYSLTPLTSGILTIPSVSLTIDGDTYSTRPVKVESKEAEESENLKLLVSLDKDTAYVGEPLLITFTWYIGMNIKDFSFSIPYFQDNNFDFIDSSESKPDPSSLVRFPLDGVSIDAVQGKGTLKGKSFTTITFSKLVIPKTTGNFNIPKSVISVSAQISGSGRSNDLFNSFFSSFSPDYGYFSVPSNNLSLKVIDLPAAGKPSNFNGYIGELNIETSAVPFKVRVGDPITFTMRISGPRNISNWNPPDLNKQYELASNFKMPSEISAGKIEGNSVIFTQTIRSLNDTVTQIPALEIPYFDTVKGVYSIAKSEAISIVVEKGSAVRVEGSTIPDTKDMQKDIVQSSNNGINYNYDDIKILKNQSFGFLVLMQFPLNLLVIIPPLSFLILLIVKYFIKSKMFVSKSGSKNSLTQLIKELKNIELEPVSEESSLRVKNIFINFIGNKIHVPKGSITEKDVKNWLSQKNLSSTDFPLIFEVFSLLDEIQYSGSQTTENDFSLKLENLIEKVFRAVEDLEGRITK